MANLRLTLLGGFEARLDSGSSSLALPRRKAEALLAYLALHAGQAQPRDKLAALLWGELSTRQARHAVRQVLLDLRKALAGVQPPLLLVESDTVRVDARRVEVDAVLFERLVAEGTPEALQAAAAAYAGDLLAGLPVDEALFEEWLLAERERLRDLALEALTKLLAHQARTDPSTAVRTATRLLALDPLQEPVHRALMRLHDEQGRRTAALRQYHVCARLLRRELGIDPEPATRELYETILRADTLVPPSTSSAPLAAERGRHRGVAAVPLVGREPELQWLRAALAEAWEERGLVAALVGEAGIGKSRLVDELAAEAMAAGGHVLVGRCYETERILPFRPWVDALRVGRILDDAVLWREVGPVWRAELARLFPELRAARPSPARSAEDHLRLFQALGEVIVRIAAQRTLLLVLEDLHWADEMSLRLLPFLGRRLDTSPILVLVTARDEELEDADLLSRGLEELDGERRLRRLTLSSLSHPDTTRLVHALAGSGQEARDLDQLGDQVWRLSEGNPLTIVELMRAVQEGVTGASGAPLSLPRRVREVIGHRLHRLSPAAGALVDAAAIVGQEFELALVSRVAELDDQAAAVAIEELIRRRILCDRDQRLDFAHERIREVARDRLASPHRRLLHGRVARALEELYAGDLEPHYAALADHCAEAEVWDRAVEYRACFAETAVRRHSHAVAVRALEQILAETARLPPGERDRRVLETVVELHMPLVLLGRVSESRELLVRHEETLHRVADPALAGRYYYALGTTEVLMGNPEEGARATRRALAEATRAGDQATIGRAHQALALADFWVGGYREAIEHGCAAVTELGGAGDPYTLGTALWIVALSYTFIGEFQPALEATDRLRAVGEATAEPRLRCSAAWTRGAIHAWRADCNLAIAACREALRLAPDRVSWASAAGWLGFAYLEKGEAGSAFEFLDQAVRHFAEFGMPYARGGFACWLAEAHLLEGRVDAARAVALQSLETTRHIRSPHGVGGAYQALGRIARARGHLREAEAHYEQALAAFASCGARFEVGRSHLILAELAFEQGNGRTASRHLATARAIFEELAVPNYLARATTLASRLGADVA